jgi:hypothetical protein
VTESTGNARRICVFMPDQRRSERSAPDSSFHPARPSCEGRHLDHPFVISFIEESIVRTNTTAARGLSASSPMKEGTMWRLAIALALLGPVMVVAGSRPSFALPRGGSESSCEVVSVGQWYCTIGGKGYYCTSPNPKDVNKECRAALTMPGGPGLGGLGGSGLPRAGRL